MKLTARKLFYSLPPAWRFTARRLYFMPLDLWEKMTGQRDGLTPPRGMIYTGGGDFRRSGEQSVELFKKLCGLQPHHNVLDIGSGIGRIAIPLTRFLNEKAIYEGFDVVEKGVVWCRDHIGSRFHNFRFKYLPIGNDLYRENGQPASIFQFPYADSSFDFAVANSVFTHMLLDEVDNYLGELSKVLKPGGVAYLTFFVFGEKTIWPKGFDFPHDYGHYRLMDDVVKSANVAFEESHLRELVSKNGLKLRQIHYGFWRGLPKSECFDFQDIVIVER
ncbi:MAG: class I SAM-dependent methyltransferase [Saprospiraceae bacterium]|nr:class I SAM-dependent methyltransferase [Saprospiraceae bacterium]